jgi:membrane protein
VIPADILITMANETAPTWMRPYRSVASQTGSILGKYLSDRGPHLAAMVAYYALLSLFPFIFLVLSAIGLLGHVSQSSYLIREMERILPSESVADLVKLTRSVQSNAGKFFVIGLVGMLWSALGFYSALESALNIVFRVGNRGFVAGKWISFVLVLSSLTVLFTSLFVATLANGWLHRHEPGELSSSIVPYLISLAFSSAGSFLFLMVVYRVLTNVDLHRGDVWPGALFGTVLFQVSFQAVPLYLQRADVLFAMRAFGGLILLLVWLYLMANVIVLGAEINWRHWSQHQPPQDDTMAGLA